MVDGKDSSVVLLIPATSIAIIMLYFPNRMTKPLTTGNQSAGGFHRSLKYQGANFHETVQGCGQVEAGGNHM